MKVTPTAITDVLVLEPNVFGDERGYFMETFNQQEFNSAVGRHVEFIQDNHSRSSKGVLRGLHYQVPPHAQGKLVRATYGAVIDVAVDLRRSSRTYGQWIALELTAANKKQVWIPPGLAHGFLVTSDIAEVQYKVTSYYDHESERSIRWNDKFLAIKWPEIGNIVLSERDKNAAEFEASPHFE